MHALVFTLLHAALSAPCLDFYTPDECAMIYSIQKGNAVVLLIDSGRISVQRLTGTFPVELSALTRLTRLSVLNSAITGTIPAQLCSMESLIDIELVQVSLSGSIPECLLLKPGMQRVKIDSSIIGGSLPSLVNSTLTRLAVVNSALSGTVPLIPSTMTRLDLSGNNLQGTLSSDLYMLESVSIARNKISGALPAVVGIPKVTYLGLSYNDLSGGIPYVSTVQRLDLSFNLYDSTRSINRGYVNTKTRIDLSACRIVKSPDVILAGLENLVIDSFDVDECALERYMCPAGASCTDGWFPKMSYTCSCK